MTATLNEADRDATPAPSGPPRRHRRRIMAIAAAAVLASAALAVWAFRTDGGQLDGEHAGAGPVAIASVTRETLADTRSFRGTLGYGEATTVSATAPGVVTRLPAQSTAVGRGSELFRVDEHPVTALLGAVPMYRDLQTGDTGADVAQLEDNLAALGYTGFTVDDTFTTATSAAVRAWQTDLGLPDSGVVRRADVVFIADAGRVDTLHVGVGATLTPGAPVLGLSGASHVVSLDIGLRDRDLLSPGTPVSVALPGGLEVPGTVTASNAVPSRDTDSTDTVIAVEVTLDQLIDESLLGARADVLVEVDQRVDVLTVPVNALLALAVGGHAVEIVNADGSLRLVPVDTGLFAGGRVEITGVGIHESTTVAVAGR